MAIAIKIYASSSGSFIGVLNLTIDKAPTKPNDNANEDFTIKITKNVVDDKIGIGEPKTIEEMSYKMATLETTKKFKYNTKKGKTEY